MQFPCGLFLWSENPPMALAALLRRRPGGVALLDGGLGSLLGPETVPGLWSASYLLDEAGCDAVRTAHAQFLDAGADIIATNR